MTNQLKTKRNNKITGVFSAIFIFMIFAGFMFFHEINSAKATDDCASSYSGTCSASCADGYTALSGYHCKFVEQKCCTKSTGSSSSSGNGSSSSASSNNPSAAASAKSKASAVVCAAGAAVPGAGIALLIPCSLLAFLSIAGWLLAAAAALFAGVIDSAKLTGVIDNAAILSAWQLVRDSLNIAFILFLLYSAFCIIFQVGGKFGEKKIILKIVLMALLVNFSYPITRFIIDLSNSLMYTLLSQFFSDKVSDPGKILTGITDQAGLKTILTANLGTPISQLIASIIFVFILALTFLAMAVLFLIRIIALGILIIFSPVAFVGLIIGKGQQWWDYLFKYAFFGPIMVFMLYLAISLMSATTNLISVSNYKDAASSSVVTAIGQLIIPIVILWIGMGVAQQMGIAGAGYVTSKAQGAATWGPRMLGKGASWSVRKGTIAGLQAIDRNVLAKRGLSPRAFIAGWKSQHAEAERKALEPASGDWHDKLERMWSLGKNKTRYKDTAVQSAILKKQKELADVNQSSEYLYSEFVAAEKAGDTEKMAAVLRLMFNNNDQNEFMKLANKKVDPFVMREEIYDRLIAKGMSENDAAKQLSDLSEIAISKGNYANYGMAEFNIKTGKYEKTTNNDKQIGAAVGKTRNIKLQTKADLWHWNSILTEVPELDADGKYTGKSTTGKLHEVGKGLLKDLKMLDLEGVKRLRGDFVANVGSEESLRQIKQYAETLGGSQEKVIKEFAKKIRELRDNSKGNDNGTETFENGAGI